MLPVGLLMKEHRLIEKMIAIIIQALEAMRGDSPADPEFLHVIIDFIRTYADQTHHGKEEAILFRDLANKPLSPSHLRTMNELIEEHKYGRTLVGTLSIGTERYQNGDYSALANILDALGKLVVFYPKHIEKEDKHFFLPCMDYFTKDEQNQMLEEFWEFDRTMIHQKYKAVVHQLMGT